MQCKAKSKQSGERCKRPAVAGREVCSIHGGKTPQGAAHGSFRHGRYSKHLPSRLMAEYEAALKDPDLLNLNDSIALIDSRINDLLTRVDSGDSGSVFKEMRKAYYALETAVRANKPRDLIDAMGSLDSLIGRGLADYAAWGELARLLDDRRKHVETKQRLETAGERAVSANELATFVGALLALIKASVSNPAEQKRIADGVDRLIGGGSRLAQ